MTKPQTGIILLAAGASKRLNRPKQLLEVNGLPMLQQILNQANKLNFTAGVLVLGATANEIREKIDPGGFEVLVNHDWQEGMASSIRGGLQHLLNKESGLEHVLILLSDQPLITEAYLDALMGQHQHSGKGITASKYGNSIGAPALFTKTYFPALLQLRGDRGAKALMKQFENDLDSLDCEAAGLDIDTPADYQQLLQRLNVNQ